MRKNKIMLIIAMIAIISLNNTLGIFAGSSIPDQYWDLKNQPYSWSAYINCCATMIL